MSEHARALVLPRQAAATRIVLAKRGDRHEQDAHRVAHDPTTASAHAAIRSTPLRVQPLAAPVGAPLTAAPPSGGHVLYGHGSPLEMAPRRRSAEGLGGRVPAVVHEVLRSPGRPLDPSTRGFMERRFGADFGSVPLRAAGEASAAVGLGAPGDRFEREADAVAGRVAGMEPVAPGGDRVDFGGVRVHADARAAESARQLGAHAFTLGRHIVFGEGEYTPHSPAGRELLAHELSHVMQQTATPAGGAAARLRHLRQPCIQGRWRLDRVSPDYHPEPTRKDGNAAAASWAIPNAVFAKVSTWQTSSFWKQKEGGSAQIAHWIRMRYVFKNDAPYTDYLQLRPEGAIVGTAKAEDLSFARASAVVWGRVIERTHENPTPGDRDMFPPLKDGGVSAATIGELGVIQADISLGERAGVNVTIPLKKVNKGDPAPFEGAISPYHEVHGNFDEVEVILGGRVTADADIRSAFASWDWAPYISRNYNNSSAIAHYDLKYDSIPAPQPRTTTSSNYPLARPWKCNAQCNVEGTEPQCTGRVYGYAEGSSEEAACREAKRDATQKAPRGCYARHCKCSCTT